MARPTRALFLPGSSLVICALLSTAFGVMVPLLQKAFLRELNTITSQVGIEKASLLLLGMVLAFFASSAAMEWGRNFSMRLGSILHRSLTATLHHMIQKTPFAAAWDASPKASLITHLSQDLPAIVALLEEALLLFIMAIFPLLAAPFILQYLTRLDVGLSTLVLLPGTLGAALVAYRHSKLFLRLKTEGEDRIKTVDEYLNLRKGLSLIHWQDFFVSRIARKTEKEARGRFTMAVNGTLMNIISLVAPSTVNIFALAWLLETQGSQLEAGTLFASYWVCSVFLLRPYRILPIAVLLSLDGSTSIRRLRQTVDVFDTLQPLAPAAETTALTSDALTIQDKALLRGGQPILQKLDLHFPKGRLSVLTGPSGIGKTSLLEDIAWNLRGSVGFCRERPFLFAGTVKDNLLMGCADGPSDAEIDELLRILKLDDLVPCHVQTLKDKGENLSGGMQQRLTLLRSLLHHPLTLFDNSLSALDPETFEQVLQHLLHLCQEGRTCIFAASDERVLKAAHHIVDLTEWKKI
jgi:ABC-type multidrug transport system fused ATPase/permease subunit